MLCVALLKKRIDKIILTELIGNTATMNTHKLFCSITPRAGQLRKLFSLFRMVGSLMVRKDHQTRRDKDILKDTFMFVFTMTISFTKDQVTVQRFHINFTRYLMGPKHLI